MNVLFPSVFKPSKCGCIVIFFIVGRLKLSHLLISKAMNVCSWFALKALRIPLPSFGILQQSQTPLQIFIFNVPFFIPSEPVLIFIAFILPGMDGIEVVKFGINVDIGVQGQGVWYVVG